MLRTISAQALDAVVEAGGECPRIGRVDGREHADTQLVAAQLAVAVHVEDAIGAQDAVKGVGIDRLVEVDCGHDLRAL